MKDIIIQKIMDGEELNTEEKVYTCELVSIGKVKTIEVDHSKEKITDAYNVNYSELNKKIKTAIEKYSKGELNVTEITENLRCTLNNQEKSSIIGLYLKHKIDEYEEEQIKLKEKLDIPTSDFLDHLLSAFKNKENEDN